MTSSPSGFTPDPSIRLDGTRALITGATSGLGLAMAHALTAAGARVAVTGRDAARAQQAAEAVGGGAIGLRMDVRDEAEVVDMAAEAWSRLGGIDLLVNNAGIGMRTVNPGFMREPRPFWDVTPDGFRALVETNFSGYFLVAREIVPRMLEAGGGRVVNITANLATMTRRGFAPYGPARAGAEALSHVMAADVEGTSVTVNLLLPGGLTMSGMVPEEEKTEEVLATALDAAVMGPPIVWLASPAADGVNDERIVAVEFNEWLAVRGLRE